MAEYSKNKESDEVAEEYSTNQKSKIIDLNEDKPKGWYVGSIDQGSSSTRFFIFDHAGQRIASHQIEVKPTYPRDGWTEYDPHEIITSIEKCIDEAVKAFTAAGHSIADIKTVGITNQRETTLVWDSEDGEPLYNAIGWTDTRSTDLVREFKNREGADEIQGICGLPLSTYPSALKLSWLLRNSETVKAKYDQGRLVFGTVDSWLLYNLNGKESNFHVTDVTNSSRTMFTNLQTLEYDSKLLDFFQLDRKKLHLPKIVPSGDPNAFGTIALGPLKGVTITGCLGDQSAALVGQQGFSQGSAKNTYGTGCFLMYNVGEKPVISSHGLSATVAYHFGGAAKPVYALEGSIATAGSAVAYLMDHMGFSKTLDTFDQVASTVADSGGCVFVTAFSGLFAPYWIDDARGTIFGITEQTRQGHIARAAIEATCFQTRAILHAIENDTAHRLTALAVDGGMTNSDLFLQTQANIINIPVERPAMRETTVLGAAITAGVAIGLWKTLDELERINHAGRTVFTSQIPPDDSDYMYQRWQKAVEMSRGWLGGAGGR